MSKAVCSKTETGSSALKAVLALLCLTCVIFALLQFSQLLWTWLSCCLFPQAALSHGSLRLPTTQGRVCPLLLYSLLPTQESQEAMGLGVRLGSSTGTVLWRRSTAFGVEPKFGFQVCLLSGLHQSLKNEIVIPVLPCCEMCFVNCCRSDTDLSPRVHLTLKKKKNTLLKILRYCKLQGVPFLCVLDTSADKAEAKRKSWVNFPCQVLLLWAAPHLSQPFSCHKPRNL